MSIVNTNKTSYKPHKKMKLSEAKEIIASIVRWQLVLNGIIGRNDIGPVKDVSVYSLKDLIRANEYAERYNERQKRKEGKRTLIFTLSDRLIAGVYFALNFPAASEMNVLINDKAACVVTPNYEQETEDQEA